MHAPYPDMGPESRKGGVGDCRVSGAAGGSFMNKFPQNSGWFNPHFQLNVENSLGIGLPGTTGAPPNRPQSLELRPDIRCR